MKKVQSKEKSLYKALNIMLRPLVRLLIHQGVTYIAFLDLLKRTYVEVADKSFALKTKRQTDSRISLLTGVHRMEVKRIRKEADEPLSDKEIKASKSAQMMSVWTGHQAYLDKQGRPHPLYLTEKDGTPSFDQLVLSVSKDKHPRSVLDEWLNQKLVVMTGDNRVELNEAGYIPEEDFEEKLFFAGKNIGDHLAVVAHNLAGETPPMFDRAVYYSGLTEQSVSLLEREAKQQMMQLLTELNRKASQLQQQDKDKDNNHYMMHAGGYFFKTGQDNAQHS